MVLIHWDLHKRKKTGGKKRIWRKKRKYELGGIPTETGLGEKRIKIDRARGGNIKIRALMDNKVNLYIPKEKKIINTRIMGVKENPANRDYSRRGVITKGCIIETEYGLAVVTSRPGQDGVINAKLIQE